MVHLRPEENSALLASDTGSECPLRKAYGETVCIDGLLWTLTYSEMAPPDQRQCTGECPHCADPLSTLALDASDNGDDQLRHMTETGETK